MSRIRAMHGNALIRVEIDRFFTGHNTDGRKADRRSAGCSGWGQTTSEALANVMSRMKKKS
jgi:hypothetical protein